MIKNFNKFKLNEANDPYKSKTYNIYLRLDFYYGWESVNTKQKIVLSENEEPSEENIKDYISIRIKEFGDIIMGWEIIKWEIAPKNEQIYPMH